MKSKARKTCWLCGISTRVWKFHSTLGVRLCEKCYKAELAKENQTPKKENE